MKRSILIIVFACVFSVFGTTTTKANDNGGHGQRYASQGASRGGHGPTVYRNNVHAYRSNPYGHGYYANRHGYPNGRIGHGYYPAYGYRGYSNYRHGGGFSLSTPGFGLRIGH